MCNLFKEWKDMSPEQKKSEKIAILAMGVVIMIIASLFIIACCVNG